MSAGVRARPDRSGPKRAILMFLVFLGGFLVGDGVRAQIPREIPSLTYRAAFSEFYDGQYRDALKDFRSEGRGAIKTPQALWLDSICYQTMVGECYYHTGHLDQALEHYSAAIRLAVAYSQWMTRVQFPPNIRVSNTGRRIPWGQSSRGARLGQYRKSFTIAMGQIDNNEPFRRGGVVQQAQLRPIQVQEIVRCTTLAIRRRTELLGPASSHDSLFQDLLASTMRPGLPNHWSEAWNDIQRGLALLAAGKEEQALPYLRRSQVAAGDFDHPMTSIALLSLGKLAMQRGKFDAASQYLHDATCAAFHYPNPGVLEEAFRLGATVHLMANRKGPFPPLSAAIAWAKVQDLTQLEVSLLLCQAENLAVLGQTKEAAVSLELARRTIGRRQMGAGRIGCRLNYLNALVLFQQKNLVEGDAALATAMNYLRQGGSHWLFHVGLADRLYTTDEIAPRTAMQLYAQVLRDPRPEDWAVEPMEAMAVLLSPHSGSFERWFDVALNERREPERALEITDRTRRHRFFSSLAYGGRLQSLRWILEGPMKSLDRQSQLLRQDLLGRYPAYEELSQQAEATRRRLQAMPLVADDSTALRQQSRELDQLASISLRQEALLREMAVRREGAGLVFPPLRSVKEIQQALAPGHAVLSFFVTGRRWYGFLLNREKYAHWSIGSTKTLSKEVAQLLREMGHFQQNHELTLKELSDPQWKQSARDVLQSILKGSRVDLSQPFEELAIVPDGLFWYVPFGALQLSSGGQLEPLIGRFRIRYAPTLSLAVPTGRGRNASGNTVVVTGKLFPRQHESVSQAAFDRLAEVIPDCVALKSPLPGPSSVYASLFDRLIVLDDLNLSGSGPYDFSPVPLDRGKPGSRLADWFRLPWQGPREVILPGFHTAAENSLKRIDRTAPGSEIFLTVCGLMSSGTETLLLSRWRTGGQTSFDLVREFAQELPHTSPADAWQRSVLLTSSSRLNLDAEPRIKRATTDDAPKAEHPFFWSGYLLIDSGTLPPQEAEPKKPAPARAEQAKARADRAEVKP